MIIEYPFMLNIKYTIITFVLEIVWIDRYHMKFNKELFYNLLILLIHKLLPFSFFITNTITQTVRKIIPPNTTIITSRTTIAIISVFSLDLDVELIPVIIS